MTDLSGQAAIVTGASRGIGAAAARELAAAGAAVLLAARTAGAIEEVAAEIRASGGRAETVTADVSRYADVEAMAGRCREAFGRLDILVNNAGVIEPIARLAERTRTPGRTPPTSTTRASISACARCCR
jgi:NAD(P)-dependent dehydrogenase (short-subunit alcohol dehydrogenase family)